ncbi:hypothetical protein AX27061_5550 [Achromobacter xylosoxidans NBRC 15126 = ATCC 27061]|nr:hypothetical protein AX27061_5550 [Achromobacter xylosoxidans NBRC 15126 = ATCC 27061]
MGPPHPFFVVPNVATPVPQAMIMVGELGSAYGVARKIAPLPLLPATVK